MNEAVARTLVATGIVLSDLTVSFNREPAVHHLDGCFAEGSMTAIVGPNGAGKSTLLKAIVGILKPDAGRISLHGLTQRDIGYLPQLADIDRSFPITVGDMVALGLWNEIGSFGRTRGTDRQRVRTALETVGLEHLAERTIGALSAGQFQRVLFARLVVQNPRVLLLDEPFAALDEGTTRDLLALVLQWHREGRTIVAVLHELEQVHAHFPSCLLMAREPVAWGPTATVLTELNLRRARTLAHDWHAEGHGRRHHG